MQNCPIPELTQFAEDVRRGLSSTPKQLSSKYFYDDEGSRLFQEIMRLSEYYLTRAEYKVFTEQTDAIGRAFARNAAAIDLIELGAGEMAESNRFLKDVESRLTKETSPRLRQSVEQGVKATMGGSQ